MSQFSDAFFAVLGFLIGSMTWTHALLIAFALYAAFVLHALHRDDNNFDLRDLLLDHRTGRASVDNFVLLLMAGLAAWTVVDQANRDRNPETLLLGVLGIFVVAREAKRFTASRTPPPPVDTPP